MRRIVAGYSATVSFPVANNIFVARICGACIFILFVLAAPEKPSPETAFLLHFGSGSRRDWLVGSANRSGTRLRRRVGSLPGIRLSNRWQDQLLVHVEMEHPLKKIRRWSAGMIARGGRNGSIDKPGLIVVGAAFGRRQIGDFINAHRQYARRRRERLHIAVAGQLVSTQHELGPDGRSGVGALKFEIGVVVIADPDDAEEIRGITG